MQHIWSATLFGLLAFGAGLFLIFKLIKRR